MNDRTEVIRAARKRLERLSKTLTEQKEGLLQGKPSNASEVCRQIVAFVDTLDRIEGARDELQKRASLVYRHCGPASPFAAARDRFVEIYTEHTRDVEPVVPKNSSRAHALASLKALLLTPGPGTEEAIVSDRVHSLVSLATSVSHLSVLHHCLEEIDRLWPWIELNAPEAIVPLRNWRLICHEIQRQSYDGEVEGCLRLWEIATADKADPSDITRMVKSLATEPNAGQQMVQAAHDLLAWAEQQQTRSIDSESLEQRHPQQSPDDQVPSSRKTVPGKRTRGRRKADDEIVQQEKEIADQWKKAKETGVYKGDFAKDHKLSLSQFDRLLDRVRKRKPS